MIIKILERAHKNVQPSRINYVFGLSNDVKINDAKINDAKINDRKINDVEFIGSNCLSPSPLFMINGKQAIDKAKLAQLKKEMSLPNKHNQRAKKTSDHFVISLAKNESLSNENWLIIIEDYLEYMGFEGCTWLATKHNDTKQEHAHIVLNNLKYDDEKSRYVQVKSNNNRQRSINARVKIERTLQKRGLEISSTPTHKTSSSNLSFSSKSKHCRKQVIKLRANIKEAKKGEIALSQKEVSAIQNTINKLNNTVKSDIHYQSSEKELIQIIKKAHAFALNTDKSVERFLLYLRSHQISPHIQFRKLKGKEKSVKRINGVSFLFKGCAFKGSNLGTTLNNKKFNKPFSAASLFTESKNEKYQKKLSFRQDEIERLTSISDRNYDVKRSVEPLNMQDKENFLFSLLPDETKILIKTSDKLKATVHAINLKSKCSIANEKDIVITKENVTDQTVLIPDLDSPIEKKMLEEESEAILADDNSPLAHLQQTDFIVAELSSTLYNKFNNLRQKTINQRKTKHGQPNFLLFTRCQRHYYAFKPNLTKTYQYLIEKEVISYQKKLTDKEVEELVQLILALVKAFLDFIRQLFDIPDVRSLDTVTFENTNHVLDVKMQNIQEVLNLFDESEYQTIEKQLNRLKPETIYVDSINNKRALAALFMSALHKVPVHYWLLLYNNNSEEPLLKSIGQHAYTVCESNALATKNRTDNKSLSKDMLYYLAHDFHVIYDPVFDGKISSLKKEDVIKAVNLAFENSDSGIDYKFTQRNLSQNFEDKYLSR
ncbi:relaxase/mobilization nuclease domain-containing protein [Colwellia piezophila]|uniref:relaxase/mobilization nuclease domain-containing protein n=1 Tax=Colwellia piezophila TaxID=211668 RepID=UPI00037678B9|nr:relaxase/mobilization nuclease domain-containing protein [Colwellia piezophila]